MNLSYFFANIKKVVRSNSPEILTAIGVSGVISTSYLAGKASFAAAEVLSDTDVPSDRKERIKVQVKHVWRLYIPAGVSGVLTIGCIIGASKTNSKRTAAAVTAYSLTERAFSEYREKVVEQIGKGKEQKVRDEIAQDRINNNPPGSKEVIIAGTGHILCCELMTHRYFRSDMETLRKAQNDINAKVVSDFYVTLDEFYDLVGLSHTSVSDKLGWNSDKLMELVFSTVLSDNNEPCLAFDYNYTKPI